MSFLAIAVSTFALIAAALVFVGVALLIETRRMHETFDIAFRGLDETNRLGFEAVSLMHERLEQRVKALERIRTS